MEHFTDIFNIGLFQNTLRTATPVILAAMGGLMTEHAGIMNIGMDGMILIGAFAAVAFSYTMASAAMGVIAAVLCGILIGLFFALFVVKLKSDEFIIGMALNTFAGGLTIYLLRTIFGVQGTFANSGIQPLPTVHIDFLDSIPVLGPLLNDNSVFIYITWAIVFLAWVFLYRTPYGFWLRAAGEHPQSLETGRDKPAENEADSQHIVRHTLRIRRSSPVVGISYHVHRGNEQRQRFHRFRLRHIRHGKSS